MVFETVQAMTPVIQGLKSASHHHWLVFRSFPVLGFVCSVWVVLWGFILCLFLKAPVLNHDWAEGVTKRTSHVLGVFCLGK